MTLYGVRYWRSYRIGGHYAGKAEETVCLVEANSEKAAATKVASLYSDPDRYSNEEGLEVVASFLGVSTVFNTLESEYSDGIEVLSRVYELDAAGNILPEWIEGHIDSTIDGQ